MPTVLEGGWEWDADNAAANISKHGVSFEEAVAVRKLIMAKQARKQVERDSADNIDIGKARYLGRGCKKDKPISLGILRRARELTQTEVAQAIDVSQARVSQLEQPGHNHELVTLRRYLEALGGRLEVVMVCEVAGKRRRYILDLAAEPASSALASPLATAPKPCRSEPRDCT